MDEDDYAFEPYLGKLSGFSYSQTNAGAICTFTYVLKTMARRLMPFQVVWAGMCLRRVSEVVTLTDPVATEARSHLFH